MYIYIWQCVKTLYPVVHIKIAGKWMFIPLKMVLIGIDPYPYHDELSGWWLTYPSEKYDFVSWDEFIPNIWKNKQCSKPPTSD